MSRQDSRDFPRIHRKLKDSWRFMSPSWHTVLRNGYPIFTIPVNPPMTLESCPLSLSRQPAGTIRRHADQRHVV